MTYHEELDRIEASLRGDKEKLLKLGLPWVVRAALKAHYALLFRRIDKERRRHVVAIKHATTKVPKEFN